MDEFTFKARSHMKNLVFYDEDLFQGAMSLLSGNDILVSVKKFKSKRSLNQNAYYWGVIIPTAQAFLEETQGEGYDKERLHMIHCSLCGIGNLETIEFLGGVLTVYGGKRTSDMNTKEFTEFLEKVRDFWANHDCFIPEPEIKITL